MRLHAFSKNSDDVTATAEAGLQVDDYYQDGGDQQQQVRVDLQQQLPDVYNDEKFHVIASGLYVMSRSIVAQNPTLMNAAYLLASLPLLLLFIIATRPFIQGVTSGAFKA